MNTIPNRCEELRMRRRAERDQPKPEREFMKTKKPDDLDRYIALRKTKDAEFAAAYESEQAEWEIGQFLLFC